MDKETLNALARHKGEPLPYPEVEPVTEISDQERQRRKDINELARKHGSALPYPNEPCDVPRQIESSEDIKETHSAKQLETLKELEHIYVDWSYLYRDKIPFEVVERCERESYEKALSTFDQEGRETFKLHYSKILRKKLDHEKSQAALPRKINDMQEIEKFKKDIISYREEYEANPFRDEEHEEEPVKSIDELPAYIELENIDKLKKKERQYVALLYNTWAIPLDKIAAQVLGVSREAICRKGGIKDRLREKLGEGWEHKIIPGRYEDR